MGAACFSFFFLLGCKQVVLIFSPCLPLFSYGEVQSVRLDQALNTCQFAFVGYRTADEAQQAVEVRCLPLYSACLCPRRSLAWECGATVHRCASRQEWLALCREGLLLGQKSRRSAHTQIKHCCEGARTQALDATAHPLGISTNNLKLRYAEPATKARCGGALVPGNGAQAMAGSPSPGTRLCCANAHACMREASGGVCPRAHVVREGRSRRARCI